jgi:hypothetical protein
MARGGVSQAETSSLADTLHLLSVNLSHRTGNQSCHRRGSRFISLPRAPAGISRGNQDEKDEGYGVFNCKCEEA